MKRLILCSISCLALAMGAFAQDKPPLQLIPPQKLLEFPNPLNPSSGKPAYGSDLWKKQNMPPSSMELTLTVNPPQSGVCSVPLLEAHAEVTDPGIAFTPRSTAVAIPQAHVPAPACAKK
jgi:hypothetical protein